MAYYAGKLLVYTVDGRFYIKAPKTKAVSYDSIIAAYIKMFDVATTHGLYIEFDDIKLFKLFRKINRIEVDNDLYNESEIKTPLAWYWGGG